MQNVFFCKEIDLGGPQILDKEVKIEYFVPIDIVFDPIACKKVKKRDVIATQPPKEEKKETKKQKAKANALKRSSSSSDSEVDASVPEKVSPEEIVKSEPSKDSTPTDSDSDSEVEIKYYLNILSLSLPYHFRHPHLLSHYTL